MNKINRSLVKSQAKKKKKKKIFALFVLSAIVLFLVSLKVVLKTTQYLTP